MTVYGGVKTWKKIQEKLNLCLNRLSGLILIELLRTPSRTYPITFLYLGSYNKILESD